MTMTTELSKESWRGRPIAERQAYVSRELMLIHPDLHVVHKTIRNLKRDSAIEEKGKALLVYANSGMGKTRLIKWYLDEFPPVHPDSGNSVVPVIAFNSPSEPSRKEFAHAIFSALQDPVKRKGSAAEVFKAATDLLKAAKTKIIFIDNSHDVPASRGSSVIENIGKTIRDLIDESRAVVVLMGTPAMEELIRVNSQTLRRTLSRSIRLFDTSNRDSRALFFMFLRKLDEMLPMAELSGLEQPEIARLICYATNGILDYILDLMIGAMRAAVRRDSEKISLEDLSAAFIYKHHDFAHCNPFNPEGPKRPLVNVGEPFHQFFDAANPRTYVPREYKKNPKKGRSEIAE